VTRPVEDADYAAFMRRGIRALVARASNDPETLALLVEIADEARQGVTTAARNCHANGFSLAEIAAPMRCTKQSVHERISRQGNPDEAVS
jgi:DNA-directed RNA polymerase specialized sigma24 family protein